MAAVQPEERQRQERAVLVMTVVATVVLAIFTYFASGRDGATTLFIIPLVASVSFWTFRVSTRIGRRLGPQPPESPAASEESLRPSERPQHARRRRDRQRRRGSGR